MGTKNFSSAFAVVILPLAVSCAGSQPPRDQPAVNGAFMSCPVPNTEIPRAGCPGIRIANARLVCGGDGKLEIQTTSDPRSGSARFVVQLKNQSNFSGTFYPVNPLCMEGLGVPTNFSFGVTYTGDQGTEPVAGGTQACIVRSKAVFSQLDTPDPILSLNKGDIEVQLHQVLDQAVISTVFGTGGAPLGRCARWTALP